MSWATAMSIPSIYPWISSMCELLIVCILYYSWNVSPLLRSPPNTNSIQTVPRFVPVRPAKNHFTTSFPATNVYLTKNNVVLCRIIWSDHHIFVEISMHWGLSCSDICNAIWQKGKLCCAWYKITSRDFDCLENGVVKRSFGVYI